MKYLEIESQIADRQREYHHAHEKATASEKHLASNHLDGLRKQLSEELAQGANPCPHCKSPAIGVHKQSQRNSDVFEVGCPACPLRSQGGSPQLAVHRWNTEDFAPPNKDHKEQAEWFKKNYPDFKPGDSAKAPAPPATEEKK